MGAALLGVGITACGSPSNNPSDEDLQAWAVTAYVPLSIFAEDLQAVDSTTMTPEELSTHCTTLQGDVHTLKQIKPYPGEPNEWNKALDEYDKGFTACIDGDYVSTANHLTEGNKHFKIVTDDMKSRKVFNNSQMMSLT